MDKNKKSIILLTIIVVIVTSLCMTLMNKNKDEKPMDNENDLTNYNVNLIQKFNEVESNHNYLISPYNIEIALNMLRDGSLGKTKEELDRVLGNRIINNVSIKNQVGIANGVFIKDIYQNDVKKDYYNTLKTKYNSDIIYDEFNSPDKINNWVKEKTNDMIPKILDRMNKDFVMGLASALAIDVKWLSPFECINTTSEEFIKVNNEKINVEMMHQTYDISGYKYINIDDAEGVIIPYKKDDKEELQLEFVGLLPKNDVNTFINNLTKEKLESIDKNVREAGNNLRIIVSLPRFKYDYSAEKFIDILKNLGIKEAFDQDNANFKKMIEIKENVYVGEAIHKTHIELNEEGTKAAAITYFGMFKATGIMPNEIETINVNFNKPFVYMIREKNTGEILFFGTVFEPNLWRGSTCDN